MVGLEKTAYEVTEDVGVVEICVVVFSDHDICSLPVPLQVSLSTNDNTAGIAINSHKACTRIKVLGLCVFVCVCVCVCRCASVLLLLHFSHIEMIPVT